MLLFGRLTEYQNTIAHQKSQGISRRSYQIASNLPYIHMPTSLRDTLLIINNQNHCGDFRQRTPPLIINDHDIKKQVIK